MTAPAGSPGREQPTPGYSHPAPQPPVPPAGPCLGPLTPIEAAGLNVWLTDTETALALTDALGQALAAMRDLQ